MSCDSVLNCLHLLPLHLTFFACPYGLGTRNKLELSALSTLLLTIEFSSPSLFGCSCELGGWTNRSLQLGEAVIFVKVRMFCLIDSGRLAMFLLSMKIKSCPFLY